MAFAVVGLDCGLGNQRLQLAAAKLCKKPYDQAVWLDEMGLEVLQKRRIISPLVSRISHADNKNFLAVT